MKTNFSFLEKVNKNLYDIVDEAEKLYRDEYFEQCMTQTRRFGESVCKYVLGSRRTTEVTFDAMLATLKDCTMGSSKEAKEFVDDLYFLKKHGNEATHSVTIHKDGVEALECLKRAFEVAINFCVYSCGSNNSILKLQYDTELLITGKKSKKTLQEKYNCAKNKSENKKQKTLKQKTQYSSVKSVRAKNRLPLFWIFMVLSSVVSIVMLIIIISL